MFCLFKYEIVLHFISFQAVLDRGSKLRADAQRIVNKFKMGSYNNGNSNDKPILQLKKCQGKILLVRQIIYSSNKFKILYPQNLKIVVI